MMKKMLILGVIGVAAPALAQTPSPPSGAGPALDPNQTICRSIADTGSRLSRSRVCMTRQQWEERNRDTRQNVERAQTQRVERQF